MRERLRARLVVAADERRPLRVYTGYDPTAPDLHLGHSITLRAMRRFQQLGHHVIVVVGTATAMVGLEQQPVQPGRDLWPDIGPQAAQQPGPAVAGRRQ